MIPGVFMPFSELFRKSGFWPFLKNSYKNSYGAEIRYAFFPLKTVRRGVCCTRSATVKKKIFRGFMPGPHVVKAVAKAGQRYAKGIVWIGLKRRCIPAY